MKGYLNRGDEGFIKINGGKWLRSGDLGYIDEEGYHHLLDRIKEVIKYKGHTVAPAELEALLLKHPAVFDAAAVIGKPDPVVGEIPKAYIVLKPEYRGKVTEEELIEWVRERIAEYKRIREVEFIEEIPRSQAGKVLRRILKERELQRMKG
ncbi:AMP-binding enzyme [Palaeococcus sp. (in: euryarchaeotes)]